MTRTVQAVYEKGKLRLIEPVELEEGTVLDVTITVESPNGSRSAAEILAEIAALPLEGTGDFSGSDHDQLLYGAKPR